MNIQVYDKTYSVEIPILGGSTQQTLNFPILQVLDRKLLCGVSTYSPQIITKSPSGASLANDALLKVSFLNLVVGDLTQIWSLPLLELCTLQLPGGTAVFNQFGTEFNNLSIIWAKSSVFISDVTKIAAAGTEESYLFKISYADVPVPMDQK